MPSSEVEPKRFFMALQQSVDVLAVTLEVEHCVDYVFEHLGAGQIAVFGDMADEHYGDRRLFGIFEQTRGALAHL